MTSYIYIYIYYGIHIISYMIYTSVSYDLLTGKLRQVLARNFPGVTSPEFPKMTFSDIELRELVGNFSTGAKAGSYTFNTCKLIIQTDEFSISE